MGRERSLGWAALALMVTGCSSPLDPNAPAWRQVDGPGPPATTYQATVYDAAGDRMLIFGGTTASGETAAVWSFDLGCRAMEPTRNRARTGASCEPRPHSRLGAWPAGHLRRAHRADQHVRGHLGARPGVAQLDPTDLRAGGTAGATASPLGHRRQQRLVLRRRGFRERLRRSLAARPGHRQLDAAPDGRRQPRRSHLRRLRLLERRPDHGRRPQPHH